MLGLAVAARGDVVGQHREVIRDDQVVLFIRPGPVRHCARLWARSVFVIRDFRQGPGSLRTLPPDFGIGRHGAVLPTVLRLRVGLGRRINSRTGRPHERRNPLEMHGCFTPSRDHRGALKERHGPFGDPFCVKRPVSEGRMARPTPFETKRKKAPMVAYGRIQHLNVAEGMGLTSNLLQVKPLFSRKKGFCLIRFRVPSPGRMRSSDEEAGRTEPDPHQRRACRIV